MYTFITWLFFSGCYLFYSTSKKRSIPVDTKWERYFAMRPTRSKLLGTLLFFVGWILLANTLGLGSGTFAVLAYIMCFGSLIVLIAPFNYFRMKHVLVLSAVCLFLESLVF